MADCSRNMTQCKQLVGWLKRRKAMCFLETRLLRHNLLPAGTKFVTVRLQSLTTLRGKVAPAKLMKKTVDSGKKKLVLIGGGHAHLFVLEALRKQPAVLQDIDVTLVTPASHLPYSGMLPGLVAGHYRTSECHVDLGTLCTAAGVRLVQGSVSSLDVRANQAFTIDAAHPFDLVSLDIGSTPPLQGIPGASEHGLAVKPIAHFLSAWRSFEAQVDLLAKPVHLVVAGAGAGGVELVLAMAHRLTSRRNLVKWSLVSRGELLPGSPRRAARMVAARLEASGVAIRTRTEIARVAADKLYFSDGSEAAFDQLIWTTGSAPQSWPAAAGLRCEADGCVSINAHLQSLSHPQVFAAGDVATDATQPRPKAGVYAVRQGPVLAENLLRAATGQELRRYQAQGDYLSLLSTGDRHAVACWYGLTWQGDWVWRWKNRIDQRFMQRFSAPFSD
jgi:selenide,water dikinase